MTTQWRVTYSGDDRDKQLQFRVKERKGKFLALNYLSGEEYGTFDSADAAKQACEQRAAQTQPPQPPPPQSPAEPAAAEPPKHEPKQAPKTTPKPTSHRR